MLPGVGGSELVLIAIVALIVVGPKDLPKLLRQLGRFVAKMRSITDDFRADMRRIENEIHDAIPPKGHYYSDAAEVPSPDAGSFDPDPDYGRPALSNEATDLNAQTPDAATVSAEPVKKPRKPRTKKTVETAEATPVEVPAPVKAPRARKTPAKATSKTSAKTDDQKTAS